MSLRMGRRNSQVNFRLVSYRLGPLPVINYFLGKFDLERVFDRLVPTEDSRCRLPDAQTLDVLLCVYMYRPWPHDKLARKPS